MAHKHEALFEATGKLLRTKGFTGASIRAIAKQAGMLPGSVTYRYPTKDALVIAMMQNGIRNAMKLFETVLSEDEVHPVRKMQLATRAILGLLAADSNAVWLLRHEWDRLPEGVRAALADDMEAFEAFSKASLEDAAQKGVLMPGIDIELVLRVFEGATTTAAQWCATECGHSLDEVADAITAVLSFGVLNPALRGGHGLFAADQQEPDTNEVNDES